MTPLGEWRIETTSALVPVLLRGLHEPAAARVGGLSATSDIRHRTEADIGKWTRSYRHLNTGKMAVSGTRRCLGIETVGSARSRRREPAEAPGIRSRMEADIREWTRTRRRSGRESMAA